jgi:2-polyprenyl-3-methyl-5-hydroxy-6-metoxy-1,4-benzoquinol methylase
MNGAVAAGAYAQKQLFSRSRLVSWSHGRRFALGQRLVAPFAGGRLLDYGCGDATFLALIAERFALAVGTDNDRVQLADCARRFRSLENVAFLRPDLLEADDRHAAAYDVVTCMEVLEHCLDLERVRVIASLRRLVTRNGRVIISVPLETGLSLPAKQLGRRVAGWRGIGDYQYTERYSWAEMARMVFAGARGAIERPRYTGREGASDFHGHKGFNWRVLEREVSAVFTIAERRCTPLPRLGTFLNSQVWLICRPR